MTGCGGIDCDTVGDTILKSLRRDDLQAAVVEDFVDIEQVEDMLLYAVGKDSVLFDCGGKCIARSQENLVMNCHCRVLYHNAAKRVSTGNGQGEIGG